MPPRCGRIYSTVSGRLGSTDRRVIDVVARRRLVGKKRNVVFHRRGSRATQRGCIDVHAYSKMFINITSTSISMRYYRKKNTIIRLLPTKKKVPTFQYISLVQPREAGQIVIWAFLALRNGQ